MEKVIVTVIGLTAIGYMLYLIWRSINGKASCSCGSENSCRSSGCCCCTEKSKPPQTSLRANCAVSSKNEEHPC